MSRTHCARFRISLLTMLAFSMPALAFEQLSLHGRGEFYLNKQNDTAQYLAPWWQKGTGQFGGTNRAVRAGLGAVRGAEGVHHIHIAQVRHFL